ncbi:RNA polymerase sigma-54 factor RpoN [Neoasaia chiangmaiensis NBRC 101099]|uniref:RNA polymerase sigma-54 factor n=1 Tax=Neoasaia chiangmaiensis TaxID=320497 RepID=A0A1U9KR95_9PROT|nr:RNA polymerase factor sigma-54 [Neoasaia chiangmaiensis]AQS88381.1 hypothetical protein A0U93_10990 [Neoasaia chiangmaiensis]GBR39395.1 RNA polymerase sigma-54 factor RpoN [Neoasaia chiangmaiensis NBRC 101099]GEN14559.1 RNA polymerase sigma-54 factor [Neoasaia chiangmaiensis]
MQAPGFLLRQTGTLAMTPRLQQAIGLLQRSNQEALAYLLAEAETNPLLIVDIGLGETAEPPDDAPISDDIATETDRIGDSLDDAPLDTLIHDEDPDRTADDLSPLERATTPSVREKLAEQLRFAALDATQRTIGEILLTMLDANGRLEGTPQDVADMLGLPVGQVEAVRRIMMQFEPVGCFACNLAECLAAQFHAKNRYDPAVEILLANLDLLADGQRARVQKRCGVDDEDFADMLAELRALDPKPGFDPEFTGQPAVPDVIAYRDDRGFAVELNEETLPRVRIDTTFATRLAAADGSAKAYMRERSGHANWLMKAMAQRSRSLLAVARVLVTHQAPFLETGLSALRPLTLREVAEKTGLHESTVSRITASRSIDTPRGVIALRAFFSNAVGTTTDGGQSAETIRHRLRALIDAETDILSDDALAARLQADGIDIMRRTVAKYRESLGIPNSAHRRRAAKLRR